MIHPDDYSFTYSSDSDWDRAAASEIGSQNPDQAWVLTDRDVWHRNPCYSGPPQPHPEDDRDEYPDPAQRYEDLHREQRDDEAAYDDYLDDY